MKTCYYFILFMSFLFASCDQTAKNKKVGTEALSQSFPVCGIPDLTDKEWFASGKKAPLIIIPSQQKAWRRKGFIIRA
jgi:hypothetical protein